MNRLNSARVADAGDYDDEGPELAKSAQGGVQAVDTGLRLLAALIALGPGTMLKTLSDRAGVPPPQAHRYLVSFCRGGLVARDRATGRYSLGPLALDMGMAALRQLDVATIATPALRELRDALGYTACLALWGTKGPTFVQVVETTADIIISVRPGSVLPVLNSATGRVFGAYLPAAQVDPLIGAELDAMRGRRSSRARATRKYADSLFEEVRRCGLGIVDGDLNPGIQGVAAPIFDYTEALVGVVTVMASVGSFEPSPDAQPARAVREMAGELSHRMGRR
ncbi:MAG TPA: IclR family transcriptional regulator [Burkholderiaceae bacterium]|nr:IclR family transcriptional regulator [Burkholderiaceae bacterium]